MLKSICTMWINDHSCVFARWRHSTMKFLNKKLMTVQHIILQKFTNFHTIRSWNFRIFAMRWWPHFLCHPVFTHCSWSMWYSYFEYQCSRYSGKMLCLSAATACENVHWSVLSDIIIQVLCLSMLYSVICVLLSLTLVQINIVINGKNGSLVPICLWLFE